MRRLVLGIAWLGWMLFAPPAVAEGHVYPNTESVGTPSVSPSEETD